MARPFGSGPIHIYTAFGPPSSISIGGLSVAGVGPASATYYGTTREGPDINEEPSFYPIMNDITGPRQSFDDGFAGREDVISLVMSSWNQAVDNAIEAFMDPTQALFARGTDALRNLGTMMVTEGMTMQIWLIKAAAFPTPKAINTGGPLPAGRRYYCCEPIGPNKPVEGNKENLRVRIFRAKKNIFFINSGNLPLFGEAAGDFTGLPSPTFG